VRGKNRVLPLLLYPALGFAFANLQACSLERSGPPLKMSVDLAKLDQAIKAKGAGIQQAAGDPGLGLAGYKCLIVRARGPGIQTPGSPAKNCNPQDWGLFTAPQENPLYTAGSTASTLTFTLQVNEGDSRKIELLGFNPYDNGSCASWSQRVLPGRFDTLIRGVHVLAEAGPVSVFASQAVELTVAAPAAGAPSVCGPYLKVADSTPVFPRRLSRAINEFQRSFYCSDTTTVVLNSSGSTQVSSANCQLDSESGTLKATLIVPLNWDDTEHPLVGSPGMKSWSLSHGDLTLPLPPVLVDTQPPAVIPSPSPFPTQLPLPEYAPGEGRGKIFQLTISDDASPLRMSAGLTERLLLTQTGGQDGVDPECDLKLFPAPESDGPQQRRFSAFLGACKNPAALNEQYSFKVVAGLMRDGGYIEEGALPSPETELATVTLDPSFFSQSAFAGLYPTNIQATAHAGSASLSWTGVSGAIGYEISYGTQIFYAPAVAGQTSQTHTISPLTNGASYSFQIRSVFPSSSPNVVVSDYRSVGPVVPILPTFQYNSGKDLCFDHNGTIEPTTASTPSPSPSPLTFSFYQAPMEEVSITPEGVISLPTGISPFHDQHFGVMAQYTPVGTDARSYQIIRISKAGHTLHSNLGTIVDFGTIPSGQWMDRTFVITNPSYNCKAVTPNLKIFDAATGGNEVTGGPFTLTGGNCPSALQPGDSCTATVRFTPPDNTSTGTVYSHYLKSSDPNGPATITLTGVVGAPGSINVTAGPSPLTPAQLTPSFLTPQLWFRVTAQALGPESQTLTVHSERFNDAIINKGAAFGSSCQPTLATPAALTCSSGPCSVDLTVNMNTCAIDPAFDFGTIWISVPQGAFSYTSGGTTVTSPAMTSLPIHLIKPPSLKISQFDLRTRRVEVDLVPGSQLAPNSPSASLYVSKNGGTSVSLTSAANTFPYNNDTLTTTTTADWTRAHHLKFELKYGQGGTILCGATGQPACPIAEIVVPLRPSSTLISNSPHDGDANNQGTGHSCMIAGSGTSSSTIQCFGEGKNGQLGNNNFANQGSPTTVSLPSGGFWRLSQISVGADFSCALTQSGQRLCWGNNSQGQLGLGTLSPNVFAAATLATNDTNRYALISAGRKHACGITYTGELFCWGYDHVTPSASHTPVKIESPHRWIAVSAGGSHTCAIQDPSTTGGAVVYKTYCWGRNHRGQLGTGSVSETPVSLTNSSEVKHASQTLDLRQVSAGSDHSCGVSKVDQQIYCWGDRTYVQTGLLPTETPQTAPAQIYFDSNGVKTVSAGHRHTCVSVGGLDAAGNPPPTLHCWGKDFEGTTVLQPQSGVLGLGVRSFMHSGLTGFTTNSKLTLSSTSTAQMTAPPPTSTHTGSTELASGAFHTCAVGLKGTDQRLFCWGKNTSGQLGINNSAVQMITLPIQHYSPLEAIPAVQASF